MDDKLQYYFKKNQLLHIFPESALSYLRLKSYAKGSYLCHAGSDLQSIYMVMDGKGKVISVSENGEQAIISYLYCYDLVGDIEYFSECPALHSVMADTQLVILVIPASTFKQYLKDWAPFLTCMCNSMAKKLYSSSLAKANHLLETTETQLLQYLAELSKAQNSRVISLNRVEAGQQLGISVRHLRRLLGQLEDAGEVERIGRSIKLLFPVF